MNAAHWLLIAGAGAAGGELIGLPAGVLAVLALVLVSGFYSGSETALVSARRTRLETLAAEGRRDARIALRLLENTPRTIAITLVGTNLANVGATALATALAVQISAEHGVALATLAVTPIVLFLGEIIPKALFRTSATRILRTLAPTLSLSALVLSPLVTLASGMTRALLWILRIPAAERRPLFRREDLASAFLHGIAVEEGVTTERAGSTLRMARRAMDLRDKKVSDAMVPLPEEWTVSSEAPLSEAIERVRRSRPPFLATVDGEGRVQGFVAAKALLGRDPTRAVGTLAKPAYVLNPDDPLDNAVGGFRRSQQSVGLVRDREGRTEGVVTAEDVLEEIVGELT